MVRVLLISLMMVFVAPHSAQAGLLEFFFPVLKPDDTRPTDRGFAPFADEPADSQESGVLPRIPEGEVPLDRPHRLIGEIGEWTMEAVGESMNFGVNYQENLAARAGLFTAAGREQYEAFLRDKNIMRVLQTGKFRVSSYVEDTPLLLNEGAVNGVYRWLYRVPVVMTYMERGMESYEETTPVSQRAILDVQVGRSDAARARDGLVIETWGGKVEVLSVDGRR